MNRPAPMVIVFLAQVLAAGAAGAALVPLTGATTTYDQGAPFTVGSSVDGVVSGLNGWGVYGGQTTPQTAVFQTTAPLTASQLTFSMPQNLGGRHTINQFRISATTDPNPTVSSGATWTVLAPDSLNAGPNMLKDVGGHMLRRSGIADTSTYTVTASPGLAGITGFRVETFVPAGGTTIGGATANGNFVLSEFMVDNGSNLALGRPVATSAPTYGGWSPLLVTDGRRDTFVHGASGTATTYAYTIDLGKPVAIDQIDIVNRGDGCCPDRLTDYRVSVHNDNGGTIGAAVWSADVRTDGSNSGVGGVDSLNAALDAAGSFAGQWVKVEKIDNGAQNYWLQVAEVEVSGQYARNLAPGAPARASGGVYPGYPASNIVDSDLNTFSHANTPGGGTFAYDFDLGGMADINSIYVHNRNDCCPERLSNYTVSLHEDDNGRPGAQVWSATVRGDGTNSGAGGVDTLTAALDSAHDFRGHWLRITGPSNVAYSPQIAEVDVYSVDPLAPVRIGLQNATADKSQPGYDVGNVLDQNPGNGWAAVRAGDSVATPQTAAFETTGDVGFADGTTLRFVLDHMAYDRHSIRQFRLAVTTADRSQFADGLANGGNLGDPSIWTELVPLSMVSTGGASAKINADHSVTLSGASPSLDSYVLTANTPLTGITGVRLETLGNPPGRYPTNGNYVLTYFTGTAVPLGAQPVNMAQSAGVRVVGVSSYNSPSLINDGATTDDVSTAAFTMPISPPTPPQGLGYDLGGHADIDSIRIYQHSAVGGSGVRRRLESVTVHTSQGPITFSGLPDQDVIDLDLGGINTSYVFIQPGNQHPGSDPRLGIREIQVFSSDMGITPWENYALGANVRLEGPGWNAGAGTPGLITDGVMTWGPDHLNSSTGVFNNQIASQNAAIVLDLGEEDLVSTLGIVQQTYGGAGARQMLEDVLLEFSNDDFATTLATRSLTLADGVVYQQVDFDAVLARYVRFHPLSQYPTGSDLNIGVVELQLFNVPEPSGLVLATFGLLALGLAGWRRRQRGCPRS